MGDLQVNSNGNLGQGPVNKQIAQVRIRTAAFGVGSNKGQARPHLSRTLLGTGHIIRGWRVPIPTLPMRLIGTFAPKWAYCRRVRQRQHEIGMARIDWRPRVSTIPLSAAAGTTSDDKRSWGLTVVPCRLKELPESRMLRTSRQESTQRLSRTPAAAIFVEDLHRTGGWS